MGAPKRGDLLRLRSLGNLAIEAMGGSRVHTAPHYCDHQLGAREPQTQRRASLREGAPSGRTWDIRRARRTLTYAAWGLRIAPFQIISAIRSRRAVRRPHAVARRLRYVAFLFSIDWYPLQILTPRRQAESLSLARTICALCRCWRFSYR